jgi:hypothetical protein
VCTLGGAECAAELFQDRDSWFQHELRKHRFKFACILCKSSASTSTELRAHTLKVHGTFTDSQLSTLGEMGTEFPTQFRARDCPFCDEWAQSLLQESTPESQIPGQIQDILVNESQFKKHVASHQEQLATLAISQANREEGTIDTNAGIYSDTMTISMAMDIDETHNNDIETENIVSPNTSNTLAGALVNRGPIGKDSSLGETPDDVFMGFETKHEVQTTDTAHNSSMRLVRNTGSDLSAAQTQETLPLTHEKQIELHKRHGERTIDTWSCVCIIIYSSNEKH